MPVWHKIFTLYQSYICIATAGGKFRLRYLDQNPVWNTGGYQDEFPSLPSAKDHSIWDSLLLFNRMAQSSLAKFDRDFYYV